MMEYRGRVRQGREQFRKELESIVPDVKIAPRLDGTFNTIHSITADCHYSLKHPPVSFSTYVIGSWHNKMWPSSTKLRGLHREADWNEDR